MWEAGEVVETLAALIPAIERAPTRHADYIAFQDRFVREALGDVSGDAPDRAARAVVAALRR